MDRNKIQVEIWSDIMCPFCYIGKRHFEKALEQFEGKENVEITWKSFQLDPTIPTDLPIQENVYAYLAKRKGISLEQSKKLHENVVQMAKEAGLDYHFEKAIVANSFKAHRIIQLAKTKGLGDEAEELFFRAYFTEGQNLGGDDTLVLLAKQIGLDEKEIKTALEDDQYAYLVKQDVQEGEQIGVRGVPFFVFNRKYGVSGAQPVEVFTKTLAQLNSEN